MNPNPRIHEPSPSSYLKAAHDPTLETITQSTALWKAMNRRAMIDREGRGTIRHRNEISFLGNLKMKLAAFLSSNRG